MICFVSSRGTSSSIGILSKKSWDPENPETRTANSASDANSERCLGDRRLQNERLLSALRPGRPMTSTESRPRASSAFDVREARGQVHGLDQTMSGRALVYLDSAGTSQRAIAAVDAMADMLRARSANIHQEGFPLAREAKREYDSARETVAKFIGAKDPAEVIWVHGSTEGINLGMSTWGEDALGRDDNIVITEQEHLSNLLPWQLLSRRTGCDLRVIETERDGSLRLDNLDRYITRRTRLVAMTHASNVTGQINPVQEIVDRARSVGARVLLDGAQSAPHIDIDVQELGCDFFVCSGHKMLGPFGTGILWGKRELLEDMTP